MPFLTPDQHSLKADEGVICKCKLPLKYFDSAEGQQSGHPVINL